MTKSKRVDTARSSSHCVVFNLCTKLKASL
jgi:hypothetical protein